MATMTVEKEAETLTDDAGTSDEGKRGEQERESNRQARVDRRNKELAAELKATRDKLAEHESAAEERASAEERTKNDFVAIEKRYQTQIEKLTKDKAEIESWKQGRERADRETALLDSVHKLLGDGVSRGIVKGQMKVLRDDYGYDTAPAELTDKIAADAAERLRKLEPDLFKARSSGSPGAPGTNGTNRPSVEYDANGRKRDPEAVALGAAYSPRGRKPPG